jgi:hypothetical protein|tara:strand:+ start:7356 stop:9377 length:2022 start_codon:yes stop_codon:yes gene_type:complete
MLRDLTQLKGIVVDEDGLSDFKLPSQLISQLKDPLSALGYELNDYTSYAITDKASVGKPAKFALIPNRYFLFSYQMHELAIELYKYSEIFDRIRQHAKKLVGDASYISNAIKTAPEMLNLFKDENDISLFSRFLDKDASEYRLGSKRLINDKGVARGTKDCFGSVILKGINIPDSSSSIYGRLVYDLCANQSVYDELLSIILENLFEAEIIIISDTSIRDFALKIFKTFYEGSWNEVVLEGDSREAKVGDATFLTKDFGPFKRLIGVFESLQDKSTLTSSGASRFFDTPVFSNDNGYYYFTSQWNGSGDYSLSFDNLKSFFELKFPEYFLEFKEGEYRLLKISTQKTLNKLHAKGASNIIYYGAPGTGKSYAIDEIVKTANHVSTVFHPETQYSDFVGCLKPSMNGSEVEYKFREGPFCKVLKVADENPQEHCYLVIEEINRASSAAVFGEIFQLLDRESNGSSRYGVDINDPDMLSYLTINAPSVIVDGQLKLPSNLSIYATMNSSDQAVMPMDTAFKRRWRFEYKAIDFSTCASGSFTILDSDKEPLTINWKDFAICTNECLADQGIPEDRHLGPWFLSSEELAEDSVNSVLTGKLFMYLWDDVLRHGLQGAVFDKSNIRNYGQLVQKFNTGELIFSEVLLDKFMKISGVKNLSLVAEPKPEYIVQNNREE